MSPEIIIKPVRDTFIMPEKGSPGSAGYDVFVAEKTLVHPGGTVLVPLGFKAQVTPGWFLALFQRSGLSIKSPGYLANCVGVGDCDYRGEYNAIVHNSGTKMMYLQVGFKIAQMILMPCVEPAITITEGELDETERDEGGYGSTGYSAVPTK